MHLKSLTLKGFKSFASSTTLHLEPGVTAVVGPNGSGKSNVVDALAWVMGEQGAKSLRGGKMEDVIFAGTPGRPALGRAEVSLTIDNSDGALPIDYTEVTISRMLFRSGGSEYAINGSPCRLLDIQELLSDSGIGREMHVIVGQGQLDSILHATPEDRRGFVEEAAGVLKHRKRKERALRKIAALEDKLSRLQDLSSELRRQLKPLGRQAEVARRARVIQTDVRDARLRLLGDDLVTARAVLEQDIANEEALLQRRNELQAQLLAAQAQESELVEAAAAAAPELDQIERTWVQLTQLTERLRAIGSVAQERRRNLGQEHQPQHHGADPDELDRRAQTLGDQRDELRGEVAAAREHAKRTVVLREAAESELARRRARTEATALAQRKAREALARAEHNATASGERLQRAEEDVATAQHAVAEAAEHLEQAQAQHEQAGQQQADSAENGQVNLAERLSVAETAHRNAKSRVQATRQDLADAERAVARLSSRIDTLTQTLAQAPDADLAAVLADSGAAVQGWLTDQVHVQAGAEAALAAILGARAAGPLVGDTSAARMVLQAMGEHGVSGELTICRPARSIDIPVGITAIPLRALVTAGPQTAQALDDLLAGVVLVDDLQAALSLVEEHPRLTAVTEQGHVLAAGWGRCGTGTNAARLQMQGALDQAHIDLQSAQVCVEQAQAVHFEAANAEAQASDALESARAAAAAHRAHEAAHAERTRAAADQVRLLQRQHDRAAQALADALARRESALQRSTEAEGQLSSARNDEAQAQQQPDQATDTERLAEELRDLRMAETEARLRLRTAEERLSAAESQVADLLEQARRERVARAAARQQEQRRQHLAATAEAAAYAVRYAQPRAEAATDAAAARRSELAAEARRRDESATTLRQHLADLRSEVDTITGSVHRDEVARAEQRLRVEQIENKAMEDFGIEPQTLTTEYGPDTLIPPSSLTTADLEDGAQEAEPYPFDRAEQERRLRSAERSLALLGKVNPLALEEFAAHEERYKYLNAQLDDLKQSRADLLGIVSEVDARVEEVFGKAFADVAVEFERVFARLFPGGEGRLLLTDPNDLLTTGVEVEARPPGKRIKRLSLLSGGERSLTAVAFLVALFRARPSPFYILDEVEAALDDTNLGRLIEVIEELRESSQLIVITHQKPTMQAADALYGVSMRGGVSQVVSQRLREAPHRHPTEPEGENLGESLDRAEAVAEHSTEVIDLRDSVRVQ